MKHAAPATIVPAGRSVPVIMFDGSTADMVNFRPEDVNWSHMAATLSKGVRWGGRHKGGAISIAQHEVMGADAIFNETGDAIAAAYFLIHDNHEAPFGDIGRPSAEAIDHYVERILAERGILAGRDIGRAAINRAKAHLDIAIHAAAGLAPLETRPVCRRTVREMDERMCFAEAKALYGVSAPIPMVRCDLPPPQLTGALRPWGAAKAEEAYLDRLERYLGIVAPPAWRSL